MQQAQLILLLTAQRAEYQHAVDALTQAIKAVEDIHLSPDAAIAMKAVEQKPTPSAPFSAQPGKAAKNVS